MNWFAACTFILFFCCTVTSENNVPLSPLTSFHPERELAKQFVHQAAFANEMMQMNTWRNFTSIQQYLIDNAMSQECDNSSCTSCTKSLMKMGLDLVRKEPYVLRVMDAIGKLQSGLMLGNIRWYGRYDQCTNNMNTTSFRGKWCGAFIGLDKQSFQNVPIGVTIGTCLPSDCSEDYLTGQLKSLAMVTGLDVAMKCPVQPTKWSTTDVLSITIFFILVALLITGTICDLLIAHDMKSKGLSVHGDGVVSESIYLEQERRQSRWSKMAISFSIIKNTRALFDTTTKPSQIGVLHGLRVLSIVWVILGHTYILPLIYLQNTVELARYYIESFTFQTVGNAYFAVDTFFYLSGVLVVYLALREMSRRNGKLSILLMYIHRYMRITPAYAFLILLLVGAFDKLGDGPHWPDLINAQSTACSKYWWTNLLYINNLHPAELMEECFMWGWYLANDMQFFLIAPISIVLLYKRPKAGALLLTFGLFATMLVTGIISKHYELQPEAVMVGHLMNLVVAGKLPTGNVPSSGNFHTVLNMTGSDQFWSDLYAKPWARIGPYLIGMLVGYVLYTTKLKIKMSKFCAFCGWTLSIIINLSLLYGLWFYIRNGEPMSVNLAAFYNASSRILWALGLSWLTIACACGYGGPVNTFLSLKFFIPLSRLSFGTYLVHPLIIFCINAQRKEDMNFSNVDFAALFVAYTVFSYFAAYLLFVVVEAPIVNLQKVVFMHRKEADATPVMSDVSESLLVNEAHEAGSDE